MKSNSLILPVVLALAGLLPQSKASIDLGTAGSFAVLANTTVTSTTTPTPNTVLNGDLGLSPGTSITGFLPIDGGPGIVNGSIYIADTVASQAQADALNAYNTLAAQPVTQTLTGETLGTGGTVSTLGPGVYSFGTSSAQLTGQLTLSGSGDFIFQIGSTLTTASGPSAASIVLENGAQAANVFWQVGSSATIGTYTSFDGTIIADSNSLSS
jgi:type VI secretion system secreted protein VgrG